MLTLGKTVTMPYGPDSYFFLYSSFLISSGAPQQLVFGGPQEFVFVAEFDPVLEVNRQYHP